MFCPSEQWGTTLAQAVRRAIGAFRGIFLLRLSLERFISYFVSFVLVLCSYKAGTRGEERQTIDKRLSSLLSPSSVLVGAFNRE